MHTAQQIINLYSLTLALAQQPLLRKANAAWRLERPFNFQIINKAAVLARLMDENDADLDKIDQVKIALASLRHFARCIDTCEVGIGEIKTALKVDVEVNVEEIKKLVRDQVKNEHLRKAMRVDQIIARRVELEKLKLEAAEARKRQNQALVEEVYQLCNASDVETTLSDGSYDVVEDGKVVDWDNYGYLVENLLERLVHPLHEMRTLAINIHNASCITSTLRAAADTRKQIEQIMHNAGIDFAKLDAEDARAEAAMAEADAHFVAQETNAEDVMALADEAMPEVALPEAAETPRKMRRVSAATAARIAEDTQIHQEALAHAAEEAARKAKAKARKTQSVSANVTSI